MSSDHAITLLSQFLQTCLLLVGPILFVTLIAGVAVGVIQTATQVQEASVSYVVKLLALISLLVAIGPALGSEILRYTRTSFGAVAEVVR